MATIRQHHGRWQVQVRLKGHRPVSRSFLSRRDAHEWAKHTESAILRGDSPTSVSKERPTVGDLLARYRDTIVIHKRCAPVETIIINAILRRPIAKCEAANLRAADMADYRDSRAQGLRPATVNRELFLIGHAFTMANDEWGFHFKNPVKGLRKCRLNRARDRRLATNESDLLRAAALSCGNLSVWPCVEFALETAMRRGEILAIEWTHIDWDKCTLHIPLTKNGCPRTIPLSSRAKAILEAQQCRGLTRPFPTTGNALRLSWQRLTSRANITNLHFHDLRHEAVSRFFERGLSVPEVALISGHRDYRTLARYTHLRAEDVAKKIG